MASVTYFSIHYIWCCLYDDDESILNLWGYETSDLNVFYICDQW